MKPLRFIFGMLREGKDGRGKLSVTRVCALLCCITGCVTALKGCDAAVVASLIAGGTVSLLTRSKVGA